MATYKVWLTIKDRYGNTKEVDGGTIEVDMTGLSETDLNKIEQLLPLNEYLKKDEAADLLDATFATDTELAQQVERVEQRVEHDNTIKYSGFFDEVGGSN